MAKRYYTFEELQALFGGMGYVEYKPVGTMGTHSMVLCVLSTTLIHVIDQTGRNFYVRPGQVLGYSTGNLWIFTEDKSPLGQWRKNNRATVRWAEKLPFGSEITYSDLPGCVVFKTGTDLSIYKDGAEIDAIEQRSFSDNVSVNGADEASNGVTYSQSVDWDLYIQTSYSWRGVDQRQQVEMVLNSSKPKKQILAAAHSWAAKMI